MHYANVKKWNIRFTKLDVSIRNNIAYYETITVAYIFLRSRYYADGEKQSHCSWNLIDLLPSIGGYEKREWNVYRWSSGSLALVRYWRINSQ